jgi:hypothetical protein
MGISKSIFEYFLEKDKDYLEHLYHLTKSDVLEFVLETKEREEKEHDDIDDYNLSYDKEMLFDMDDEVEKIIREQIGRFEKKLQKLKLKEIKLISDYASPGESLEWKINMKLKMERVKRKIAKCEKILNKLNFSLPEKIDYMRNIEEKIEKARNFPLCALVDVKRETHTDYMCHCPFHEDTRPSMYISKAKNLYYCFVCNEGGSPITYVQKKYNLSFRDAVEKLCE